MSAKLCLAFQEMARSTAEKMRTAYKCKMPWNEETNTETILLKLVSSYPQHVRVKTFSKRAESRNGADWEWWFVDNNRQFGFPMRIQAKRIHPKSGEFESLFHPKNSKGQMRTLLRQAKCDDMLPGYVFYTYLPDPSCAEELCEMLRPAGCDDLLGCLFSPADQVAFAGSRKIEDLQTICRPWHELVCSCRLNSIGGDASLPDRVRDFFLNTKQRSHSVDSSAAPKDFPSYSVPKIRELPGYVRWIASGDFSADEIVDSLEVDAEAIERGIQGVVVVIDPESYSG